MVPEGRLARKSTAGAATCVTAMDMTPVILLAYKTMAITAPGRGRGQLREVILDAAVRTLREAGLKSLTQSKVARAAGIPQGHLTYYFPRRADLLLAVAQRTVELAARDVSAAAGEAEAREPRALWRAIARRMVKDRERTRMLLGLLVEAEDDPALQTAMLDNLGVLRRAVAAALGRTPDDGDVDLVIAAYWGLGIQHFMLAGRRSDAATDALCARLDHHLQGLASPGARPAATNEKPKPRR